MTVPAARRDVIVNSVFSVTRWLALFTAPPDPVTGGGTEVSPTGTGYVRAQLTASAGPTDGTRWFAGEWPSIAILSWGIVTHYGIMTTSTVGDLAIGDFIAFEALTAPLEVLPNMRPRFTSASIVFAVDEGPCPP